MSAISVTVDREVGADITHAFAVAVPIDLVGVMQAKGPIPGVAGVENQTGPWDAVGQSRTVRLTDGSAAYEELTSYTPPRRFAYRVSGFTGPFHRLVKDAYGEWVFSEPKEGRTRIDWTYSFMPRGPLSRPLVFLIAKLFWRGYIDEALGRVAIEIERPGAA